MELVDSEKSLQVNLQHGHVLLYGK